MTASIRDLELFIAAYEELSFSAAATREGATQSGVSQHIAKLEEMFRLKLFFRGAAGLSATPAANVLYNRSSEILRLHKRTHIELYEYSKGLEGEIRIGLVPSLTRCALAPVLASFISLHPNASVGVVEGPSSLLAEQVKIGEIEFAIVPALFEAPGLSNQLILTTPELLVSRKRADDHEGPVRLAELDPLKVIVPSKSIGRRRSLDRYFAMNGIKIANLLELDAMHGALHFLSRTDWVTILPAIMMSAPDDTRQFNLRPIADPPLLLEFLLVESVRRPISGAAAALLELLKEEFKSLNARWL